ncbi:MAG: hypothetical protein M3092_02670 [Actinomycetia bacterium]|nr:hypothetical protein [Actinomycetes bacterium]
MTLTIQDLNLHGELPELPRSIPIAKLEAPTLDERQRAIEVLTETLGLADLRRGETGQSTAFAGKGGEIEFFPASGAVWARDAAADTGYDNELRDWQGLEKTRTADGTVYALNEDISASLVERSRALIEATGFVELHADRTSVVLDQVAELDEKGRIIQSGAGAATVVTTYSLEGLPVMGAGAKTHVYMEPTRRAVRTTGLFHCWRRITDTYKFDLSGVEEALQVGLLKDPELLMYHEKGSRIEVTELTFGYLALPAMVTQEILLPSFSVAGTVRLRDDKMEYFEFARYHHAVSVDQYSDLGLFNPQFAIMN